MKAAVGKYNYIGMRTIVGLLTISQTISGPPLRRVRDDAKVKYRSKRRMHRSKTMHRKNLKRVLLYAYHPHLPFLQMNIVFTRMHVV